MTGRGRPQVGPRIPVRIPPDMLAAIDAAAAAESCTRAEMIRRLIARTLDH